MPKACADMKQTFYSLNLLSHLESDIPTLVSPFVTVVGDPQPLSSTLLPLP